MHTNNEINVCDLLVSLILIFYSNVIAGSLASQLIYLFSLMYKFDNLIVIISCINIEPWFYLIIVTLTVLGIGPGVTAEVTHLSAHNAVIQHTRSVGVAP